jgi:3-(3-hydroxy-phenyl)propionate hydroxylase
MDCDVAIVGYGPVGATAAALLGGQGLKVAVVERMAGVYDKPRAITADHEVMRCMQFAGIGHELGAHVRPHPGTRYLGVDGNTIKQTDVIPPPYPLADRHPFHPARIRGHVAQRRCTAWQHRSAALA